VAFVAAISSLPCVPRDATNGPFGIAVRSWSSGRDRDHVEVVGGENGSNGDRELGVTVAECEPNAVICSPGSLSGLRAAWVVPVVVG
jgi:hypothetical protein